MNRYTIENSNISSDSIALNTLFALINNKGFTPDTIQLIDNYINDIYNGNINTDRFNTPEHAGLCSAGKVLIGAQTIASYARASLGSGRDAGESQAAIPSNWQIDEAQETLVEQWAHAAGVWYEDSERQISEAYGPKIAQGAEAKVYYKSGDTCVLKERASLPVWGSKTGLESRLRSFVVTHNQLLSNR